MTKGDACETFSARRYAHSDSADYHAEAQKEMVHFVGEVFPWAG